MNFFIQLFHFDPLAPWLFFVETNCGRFKNSMHWFLNGRDKDSHERRPPPPPHPLPLPFSSEYPPPRDRNRKRRQDPGAQTNFSLKGQENANSVISGILDQISTNGTNSDAKSLLGTIQQPSIGRRYLISCYRRGDILNGKKIKYLWKNRWIFRWKNI